MTDRAYARQAKSDAPAADRSAPASFHRGAKAGMPAFLGGDGPAAVPATPEDAYHFLYTAPVDDAARATIRCGRCGQAFLAAL